MILLFVIAAVAFFAGIFFQKQARHKLLAGVIWLVSFPISVLSAGWMGLGDEKFISTADFSVGPAFYAALVIFLVINASAQIGILVLQKQKTAT